jgi:hypothetical protein
MHTNAHKWAKKRDMKWHAFFRSTINTVRHTPLLMEKDKREWDRVACGERADELHMCKHWQRDRLERKGGTSWGWGQKLSLSSSENPPTKNPINNRRGARKKKKKKKNKKGAQKKREGERRWKFVWQFICMTRNQWVFVLYNVYRKRKKAFLSPLN